MAKIGNPGNLIEKKALNVAVRIFSLLLLLPLRS